MARYWLNFDLLKTVVPLVRRISQMKIENEAENSIQTAVIPDGTGFFMNYLKLPLLVTARHIAMDRKDLGALVYNKKDGYFTHDGCGFIDITALQNDSGLKWIYNSDKTVDVAVSIIGLTKDTQHIQFPFEMMESNLANLFGEDIFYAGFPLGKFISEYPIPLVRSGIVAGYSPDRKIIIEGNVFNGSSGSPVWLKPQFIVKKGNQIQMGETPPSLIGIVSAYFPYIEEEFDIKNDQKEVNYYHEENSGLGIIEPSHRIIEILNSDEFKEQIEIVRSLK